MEKREALLGGSGQTGAVLHPDGRHLLLPLLGGDVERRVEVLSDGIHCGPRLEQKTTMSTFPTFREAM